MRNPRLGKWPDDPHEGLLLAVQRIEEASSTRTPDSYRAPALNTHSRAKELVHAVVSTRAGDFARALLIPIVEELADSISRDLVARELLAERAEYFSGIRHWPVKDLPTLEVWARTLDRLLSAKYETALKARLIALVEVGKAKADIQSVAVSLITEWILKGFSEDYVYLSVRQCFSSHTPIDLSRPPRACLEELFARFDRGEVDYEVLIPVSDDFDRIGDSLPDAVFDIVSSSDVVPAITDAQKGRGFPGDTTVVRMPGVRAQDPRAAVLRARRVVSAIRSVAHLHDHRSDYDWNGPALVRWDDAEWVVLQRRKRPVERQTSGGGRNLHKRLGKTILSTGHAWARIGPALELHAEALRASRPEEQLLALWVALESLLPLREAESRISKIVELTVPLLSRKYPVKRLKLLDRDLEACAPAELQSAMAKVPRQSTRFGRFALLVAADEYDSARSDLYSALDHNPLLRNRLFLLNRDVAGAREVRELILAHESRVTWHLFRIYRTRNLIVHTGGSLPYVEALVENLHAYFLRIIQLIEEGLGDEEVPQDLDGAILQVAFSHRAHMDALVRAGAGRVSAENVEGLLLG